VSTSHGKETTLALAFGALGVVYGDIGTSPIYAFKESLANAGTSQSEVFGVASLLFWSLMLVVTIKYLVFVLRADNGGEGGILALFSLLPRSMRRPTTKNQIFIFTLML
jgi:KUP system potassium uptake protein